MHAIMGPNGSGKSTLARCSPVARPTRSPRARCSIRARTFWICDAEERAREGLFLAFQYPVEIPGVNNQLLPQGGAERHSQAPQSGRARRHRVPEAGEEQDEAAGDGLQLHESRGQRGFLRRREEAQRDLPDGGARAELAMLDETDSGLDIDALRVVADGVNAMQKPTRRRRSSW